MGQVWRGWGVKLLLFFALMVAGWGLGVGDAQAQEDELLPLGIIVQPEPGELEVWIETDQRRYDLGDEVTIRFGLNRDAWVYIYNLDADGRVSLLFPNRFDRQNRVRAGTHRLPRRGYAFEAAGPPGVEYLQIIASRTPLELSREGAWAQEPFPDLGAAGLLEAKVRSQLRTVPADDWAVAWTSFRVGRPTPPPPPPAPAPPAKPKAWEPSVHLGLDVGWGPDPEQPHRIIFSFGGDVGSPDLGLGFSLRLTGEEPHPGWYQRGPETELYGRFTLVRSGSFDVRTGVGLAWQAWAYGGSPPFRSETRVRPTFLLGAGFRQGPGYTWVGYHVRRGMVLGVALQF
mgnify:FL=1